MQKNLEHCLSKLPEGVTADYEIVSGVTTWRLTEKPVGLTLEQENKILRDLHLASNANEINKIK